MIIRMRIFVRVKTRAKQTMTTRVDETHFIVSVKEAPVDGKANEAVVEALADYFSLPRSHFLILIGKSSKQKVIEIA